MNEKKIGASLKSFLPTAAGLLLLAVIILGTWAVVGHFRQSGRSTILESQAMDMSAMVAPRGMVPVAVETLRSAPLGAAVTYTGTVVPYNESPIYPRVSGWLLRLDVYPGDLVTEGQEIGILDSAELASRVKEAQAALSAAAAGSESSQSQLDEARARVGASRAALRSKAAAVEVMKAEFSYWESEIKREKALYDEGAVSREELDNEIARYRQARAGVAASRAELDAARREHQAALAMQRAAQASTREAAAMTTQRSAAHDTASIVLGYTRLVSPYRGVVTRRLISPGTLVGPGMAIINLAQIDRVRIQINVSGEDLAGIKVGNPVTLHTMDNSARVLQAKVTAIFPAADPVARTSVVEAVIPNPGHRLIPGQFVTATISTGPAKAVLSVPNRAIGRLDVDQKPFVWVVQNQAAPGATLYTCVMHPEVVMDHPGDCPKCGMKLVPKETPGQERAYKVMVTTGVDSGERTEIASGLKPGDRVVTDGQDDLGEGAQVFVTTWGTSGPMKLPPAPSGEMPGMPPQPSPKPSGAMPPMPGM